MRIRQVKPAFWADSTIAGLPERTRLFYIGLWCLADDAGWFRWDAAEVGRELYGFDPRRARETKVVKMLAELDAADRVTTHPCGHIEIPKLAEHQHLATEAKQVRTSLNEHINRCLAATREDPRKPAETRLGNGKEKVSEGKERVDARERAIEEYDREVGEKQKRRLGILEAVAS